jgi:hypothetical protein
MNFTFARLPWIIHIKIIRTDYGINIFIILTGSLNVEISGCFSWW